MPVKIISYNVNGIRAARKKGLSSTLVHAEIISDVYHSDHCPVKIDMERMG